MLFLALSGVAAAVQPSDVIREFTSGMGLTRESQRACALVRDGLAKSWYPVVPTSNIKLIDVYSFTQTLDLQSTKSMVDLWATATGLDAYDVWDTNSRTYTFAGTPNYGYVVGIFDVGTADDVIGKTAVCVALAGIRK